MGFVQSDKVIISLILLFVGRALFSSGCFDFNKQITQPLREPLSLSKTGDATENGQKNGIDWGAARGIVKKPILEVYKKLLDHRTVKDMGRTRLLTKQIKRPGYLDFHRVDVTVRVFGPITVSWVEEWGYHLAEGTPELPTKIVISYQKVEGTSYIQHQCGSFVLKAQDAKSTDVFLYEQVKASHRDAEDTVKMVVGILRTIRDNGRDDG